MWFQNLIHASNFNLVLFCFLKPKFVYPLVDTSIIEEVDDDHIETLVHDTNQDINLSEEDQENDNNNEENSNFDDNDV